METGIHQVVSRVASAEINGSSRTCAFRRLLALTISLANLSPVFRRDAVRTRGRASLPITDERWVTATACVLPFLRMLLPAASENYLPRTSNPLSNHEIRSSRKLGINLGAVYSPG